MNKHLIVAALAVLPATIFLQTVAGCGGNSAPGSTPVPEAAPCGTPGPTLSEQLKVEAAIAGARSLPPGPTLVTVPVYVHIITSSDGTVGNVSDALINTQISVLNRAYSGQDAPGGFNTKFRFTLVSIDRTANDAWFTCSQYSPDEVAMKTALRVGTADDLNLYIRNLPGTLSGYGEYPWWFAGNPIMDGPSIDYLGLPGGQPDQLGDLAVHEVGHWLGLLHTFEGGCNATNDGVNDTPAQAGPTSGCPAGPIDTCTGPKFKGNDPTMNFMDYTADQCQYQFTSNQSSRMDTMWATYRKGK